MVLENDHIFHMPSGTLAAHGFDPPWLFPTVNELKCKLGYGFLEDMNVKKRLFLHIDINMNGDS